MAAKILFKYASRGRKDNFFRGLDSIYNNLANTEDFNVLATFDADDKEYRNFAFIDQLSTYHNLEYYFGISTGKTNAINRDLPLAQPFDIIINFSDDQVFLVNGFDDIIRNDMQQFSKDYDCFLHYPDGTPAKDVLCTMSIFGRVYFERFGYIYNPEYQSVYSDNEATEVARELKKYKFVNKQIYSHLHPAWGTAQNDELYKRNENKELYAIDQQTYMRRKKNNFYL